MLRSDSRRVLMILLGSIMWILCATSMATEDNQGVDFYPLWTGASAFSEGKSPYAEEVSQHIASTWNVAKGDIRSHYAVSYPLPALIPFMPLTLLSFAQGLFLWKLFLLLGVCLAAIVILRHTRHVAYAILPFLYYPVYHAYDVKNPALLWFVGLLVTLKLIQTPYWFLSGILLAILPAKPQAALLLVGLYYWMSLQDDRRHFYAGLVCTAFLWGGLTVLYPSWPMAWLQAAQEYQQQVRPLVLLPTSLLLLACSYRMSVVGIIAVAQVIFFPVTDIYVTLPLLLAYLEIRVSVALCACLFSWLAPLYYQYPNDLQPLWLTLLLPFSMAAVIGSKRKRPIWISEEYDSLDAQS